VTDAALSGRPGVATTADPDDDGRRRRITTDLAATLTVRAAPGTGATTALVSRVVELVRVESVPLARVMVVTATEAAGIDLRRRLGTALAEAARRHPRSETLARAVDEVDDATIGTVAAWARDVLAEHAVEAGLPVGFRVVDDGTAAAAGTAHWVRFVEGLLDDDPNPDLVRLLALGIRPPDLVDLARALERHWDRFGSGGRPPRPVAIRPGLDVTSLVPLLDAALQRRPGCSDEGDLLFVHLQRTIAPARAALVDAGDDEASILRLLATLGPFTCGAGAGANWGGDAGPVREVCRAAEAMRRDLLATTGQAALAALVVRLEPVVLAGAEERRHRGRLTARDLVVHALGLIRGNEVVADRLRGRHRWVLVDGAPEDDPAAELLAWLVSDRPGGLVVLRPAPPSPRPRRPEGETDPVTADEDLLGVVLTTTFRSVRGIVAFLNALDADVSTGASAAETVGEAEPELRSGTRLRAARPPLRASMRPGPRGAASDDGDGTEVQLSFTGLEPSPAPGRARRRGPAAPVPVVTLGGPVLGSPGEVRRRAALAVADAVARVVTESWPVTDAGAVRPARWGDVTVVVADRPAVAELEDAFEAGSVPFGLEGSDLLWATPEVRDVMAVLVAADEPADPVAVLAALRCPYLACGDDDLVIWHDAGGSWDFLEPVPPDVADHPVARAMGVLGHLYRQRWWSDPAALVRHVLDLGNAFEIAAVEPNPEEHWRRLRWLVAQARAFEDGEGGSLRDFLRWAASGGAGTRPPGADPPVAPGAVRVTTLSGPMRPQSPVLVLAGLDRVDRDRASPPPVVWDERGRPEARIRHVRTAGYDDAWAYRAERDRLGRRHALGAAAARASDHLIVTLYHREHEVGGPSAAAQLHRLCERRPDLWRRLPILDGTPPTSTTP
jgi:ATP-dependent helicase/nuclease subunit A